MNRFALLGCLIPSLALSAAIPTAYPSGSQGAVTLDWVKFNEMWTQMQEMEKKIEKLQHPETRPPVPYTISRAAYKGEVGKQKVDVSALFEVDIFDAKNWVKVPFLPATAAILDAKLDGAPVGIIQADGFHQFVARGAGRHALNIRFSLKAPEAEQAPRLHLDVLRTPMTYLSMKFPLKKLDVTIEPSQGMETRATEDGRTLVTAAIPPTSQIDLRWQKALADENTEPAKLYVETEGLLTLSEGNARAHYLLNYNILHRGIHDVLIAVPAGWNVLAAAADGMQEWKIIDSPQGPELQIQLAYAKKGPLAVSIDLEKGIGEKEEVIELPRLKPVNVEREQGTLGVEAKGSIELTVAESDGLNPIDPQELPGSLWQAATQPILYAFRYTKPHSLSIAMKRHPEVAVLTTTIDDANAVTLMTKTGQAVTRIRYQVRNHLRQYLTLRLPAGAQFWSAYVAGEPVKPTQVEKDLYRIPLAKSQIQGNGQQGFAVDIVYYLAAPHFAPLGFRAAQFPVPDAPASRVFWSLYLPEKLRFVYFGGDMEKGQMATPWQSLAGGAVVSRAEFALQDASGNKDERMARRKSALREDLHSLAAALGADYAGLPANGPMPVSNQEALESETVSGNGNQLSAGVFPIAFDVPASGQLFHFGQVMVVGQAPQVTMYYLHLRLIQTMEALFLGWLCALIYRRRQAIQYFLKSVVWPFLKIVIPHRRTNTVTA